MVLSKSERDISLLEVYVALCILSPSVQWIYKSTSQMLCNLLWKHEMARRYLNAVWKLNWGNVSPEH